MRILCEIETHDKLLAYDIFNTNNLAASETKTAITDNIQAVYDGTLQVKSFSSELIKIVFIIPDELITKLDYIAPALAFFIGKYSSRTTNNIYINGSNIENIQPETIEMTIANTIKNEKK